ncbi:MAG: hypothetical protein EBU80_01800 [Chitinophagia bacterium]|jgi:SprT protein|nr:hypothetical protein [Chitinophagia bacterium]
MSKKEVSISSLSDFLPQGTFELVEPFLLHYKVHLTITKSRATVLGDYRNAIEGKAHRISVNGNLNQYAFLITLLHELAHLITYVRFGNKVASHGREWKDQFSDLLKHFIQSNIFPQDIRLQIAASMKSPAASSCADDALMRVLRKYDAVKENHFLVEEIEQGRCFQTKNGKVYKREEKIRKRIKATEVDTGRVYLFSPIYEVMKVN